MKNIETANAIARVLDMEGRRVKLELAGGGIAEGVLTHIETSSFEVDDGSKHVGKWPQKLVLDNEVLFTHDFSGVRKISLA